MSRPDDARTDTTAPAPSRFGRVVRWVFGGVAAVVVLVLLGFGLWAASAGSLAQALGWGQSFMARQGPSAGTLTVADVQGSLLRGGQIARLEWQRDGLSVVATDTRIGLSSWFWADALLGRGVRLSQLDIARLEIDDQRPPSPDAPPEPLQPITLPVQVTLPWSIGELVLAGASPLTLSGMKGQYRYRTADSVWNLGVADAHQFDLDSLQVAGGRYQAKAVLGAQSPMPLRVDASGEVQTKVPGSEENVTLQAIANITGTLATTDAALDATASVKAASGAAGAPTLDGKARLRPWGAQPIETADIAMERIDLHAFWPQAPVTQLGGTVKAQPEGEAWRAELRLANAGSGPADQQRLPLDRINVDLEQRGARWTLSQLDAQLAGGAVQGQGWWEPGTGAQASALGQWQGDIKATRINPARIWSSIAPAALDGTVTARTVDADTPRAAIDLTARVLPSGTQPRGGTLTAVRLRELALQGRWRPLANDAAQGVLELREARLNAADAELDGKGAFDTVARSFDGQIALELPGAKASWKGKTAHAQGNGDLDLNLADASRVLAWVRSLQTLPVVGPKIRSALDGLPGLQAEGSAQLNAEWQGGLGVFGYPPPTTGARNAAPPRLEVDLSAPRLRVTREVATGKPESPTATQAINLSAFRLDANGPPERLDLRLAGQAEQGPWRAEIDTQGVLQMGNARKPDFDVGRLELSRLKLQATDSARPDRTVEWTLESVAALAVQWQGARSTLQVQADPGQLRLQPVFRRRAAPAPASAPTVVAASPAATAAAAAIPTVTTPLTLAWERISWRAGALDTRGRLTSLPLSWIDALATPQGARNGPLSDAGLGGDVVFDGAWDLSLPADASAPPRLSAQLQRRSGDLSVQTDGNFDESGPSRQRVQTGIRAAQLEIETQGSNVLAKLRWDSERLGQATADLSTALSPPNAEQNAWHWGEEAPLRGTIKASLPEVGVWSALAPPGWRVRGSLGADLTLGGTRDKPLFNGALNADDLALRSLVNGISFSRGQLRATLAGERITIDRFYLQGRGGAENGGTLLATGTTEWRTVTVDGQPRRQPYINLQATATKLRVSTRADRLLTLSGQLQAELAGTALQLRGQLTADSALFVLPDESTPSLGEDVVVRGTERPLENPNAFRVQPDVLVDLNLGENFEVRGMGVQTRLGGQLNVRSTPASPAPRVIGEVRTVRGTYRAYGQRLTIESGLLRFNGPYDNPTLDITAVRPNTAQRVGVLISGNAQMPRVRLFSDPELPDSEKLAWLVLGRPASGAGAEAAVLQQAALALLSRNGGNLDGGIASRFGLDELSFAGSATNADGTTTGAALTLGKRLSNKLYLTYEASLAGAMGTVSMFYDLSRRVTVRARAGEENAIDLIFTTTYD
ncbi:translocation/assembly module TamB domain-containing protein [Hydrogenophaga sp.]|uniref:translocation/assembly module TamB domain-containing protein n=1 Tax=Hydrogenophaga sp. TaxID=1904254 RepID=UPI002721EE87|nr:translocation/assembly module TamB domain-containing protein [Hydrogenophaga sp.]MDO9436951.1 translocation/assembly module TamB domain-containing protein [Hydrogenophaga sp.]